MDDEYGAKHEQFRQALKEYLKVDELELMVNGHMAIELGIQAFNFSPGSEIITTPFTFASTTHAIVRNGMKPVFCDISPSTLTLDPQQLESCITEKTVAILPVHVYGTVCDIERIEEVAKRHGLKVLYDAAHIFGETYKGKGIASYGDMSFLSFHATKVFNSVEGGAACFRDHGMAQQLYDLKNFGIHSPEVVASVGGNAKMNEFCAAMGICNLRHVDGEIQKRKKVVERYNSHLAGVQGVTLKVEQPEVESNYAYYPVLFDKEEYGMDRNQLAEMLGQHNIFPRKYFYPLTTSYACYKDQYDVADTPIAKRVSEQVLTLPLYADLELERVDEICTHILDRK